MSCPSIWATLSALLINILGSFQLFLHSDQPLSEGEIIPFSGVCQSGGCIIHAGGVVASRTDRQTALMCNRRRPAATSSRRASFSALHQLTPFVYFASSAATSRWRICMSSNCRVRQLQFSYFVALGFVGNGVITVMINSPWQADDDADNQSGDNRGDSAHTSISRPFRPLLWILQSGCQPYAQTTITSARQWSPDIAATVDCLTDITTINQVKRHAP